MIELYVVEDEMSEETILGLSEWLTTQVFGKIEVIERNFDPLRYVISHDPRATTYQVVQFEDDRDAVLFKLKYAEYIMSEETLTERNDQIRRRDEASAKIVEKIMKTVSPFNIQKFPLTSFPPIA